jgi:hypothetical protein
MCNVFFRGGGKKKLDVFFPPKKPQMSAGREAVPRHIGYHQKAPVIARMINALY